jgi:hypothetical protein
MNNNNLNIQGFILNLKGEVSKDSKLNLDAIELKQAEDYMSSINRIIDYFRNSKKLYGIDEIQVQGLVVGPVFSAQRVSYKPVGIGLVLSVASYDKIKRVATIKPLNFEAVRQYYQEKFEKEKNYEGRERYRDVYGSISISELLQNIAWYIDMSQIYPFALVRIFKILHNTDRNKLENTLRKLYSNYKEALSITLSKLKVPSRYSIDAKSCNDCYIVLMRRHRYFASTVLSKDDLRKLFSASIDKLIIYYNAEYLITHESDVAYYYSAAFNYLIHKASLLSGGGLARSHFGRIILAIKDTNLEWAEEPWQRNIANLSQKIHKGARSVVLKKLGLPKDLELFELIDYGRDIETKIRLGEEVKSILSTLRSEISEVNTAFSIFDENIDQGRLKEAIKLVLESKQGKGSSDEEAGLDNNEEEENNGGNILDFLK